MFSVESIYQPTQPRMPTSTYTPRQLARIAREIGDLIECMGADCPNSVINNAELREVRRTFDQIVEHIESHEMMTQRMNPIAIMISEMIHSRIGGNFDARKFEGILIKYDGNVLRMTLNGHSDITERAREIGAFGMTAAEPVPPAYEESTSTSEEEPPTYTPAPKPKPSKKKKNNKKNKNRRK